jgi:hypothetical protein
MLKGPGEKFCSITPAAQCHGTGWAASIRKAWLMYVSGLCAGFEGEPHAAASWPVSYSEASYISVFHMLCAASLYPYIV